MFVATVLTVYGIETHVAVWVMELRELQQYLPFTVLKLITDSSKESIGCCNSTYRLRY